MATCSRTFTRKFSGTTSLGSWIHKWPRFKRWQELQKANEDHVVEKTRMKNFIRLPTGLYITPERPEDLAPKKATADMTRRETGALPMDLLTWHTQMRYVDHSLDNIRRYNRYTNFQHMQYDQRMIPERLLFLGADLAAAHFLVHRGAAVKFLGDDSWYKRDKRKQYKLPGRKVENLLIEAIDASGTSLMFEGLENLEGLLKLRLLRLANCEYVDDWFLGRVGAMFPELEMLDLSGCDRISAKGLMGLKSMKKLKYLRLEGLDVKDVGKAALLLEETIPRLQILGVDYENCLERVEAEIRLLEDERVVQDARGNAFVEDDNGRLFYVMGDVDERAVVDDGDNPIMTSTVRREIPDMSDEQFDKINALSGGKLKHLLVGSPSGYEWTSTTETILQSEAEWKSRAGIDVNPKMLPGRTYEIEKQNKLEEEKKRFFENFPSHEQLGDEESEQRKISHGS
ncbi:unnamed protein product [Caenorhabditis auriculariae]|uniref:ATP synthase subunit s-like protein n=1 Tax=Caenorhabditis auriculariae TaxID=2777116 RepID=A0A8S1H0K1_9PELO|nr:unnamed protein product [Caenorhabditis auriculariae]